MNNQSGMPSLDNNTQSRREFLYQMVKNAAAAGAISSTVISQMQQAFGSEEEVVRAVTSREFAEALDLELSPNMPVSMLSGNFEHPDNKATRDILRKVLPYASGQDDEAVQEITSGQEGSLEKLKGNVLVIGGANSTRETQLLLGFRGPNDREMERVEGDDDIPLAYSGIGSEEFVLREAEKAGVPPKCSRIMRTTPEPKWVRQWNWPLKIEKTGKLVWVDGLKGDDGAYITHRMEADGEVSDLPIAGEDLAIVTGMPNLLDPNFTETNARATIIEGRSGMATAAMARLLSENSEAGKRLRSEIEEWKQQLPEGKLPSQYQMLFKLSGIKMTEGGFHDLQEAALIDITPLECGDEQLQRIHRTIQERLREGM